MYKTHKITFITLIPDNQNHTITPSSPEGWYVLYPPTSNLETNLTALPIYIPSPVPPNLVGWTTNIPISCNNGGTNYPTGLCKLIFQYLEDDLFTQKSINTTSQSQTVEKSLLSVAGRVLLPNKPYPELIIDSEYYCFYKGSTDCKDLTVKNLPPITPELLRNWKICFITYSDIPASPLVCTKTFGLAVEGTYRKIGNLEDFINSYNPLLFLNNYPYLPNIIQTTPPTPPIVTWDIPSQTLTISNNPSLTPIILAFSTTFSGFIQTDEEINQTSPQSFKTKPLQPTSTYNLTNLFFNSSPVSLNTIIGNQTTSFTL